VSWPLLTDLGSMSWLQEKAKELRSKGEANLGAWDKV
jgi:hypothetical protein